MLRSNFSKAVLLPAFVTLLALTYFGVVGQYAPGLRLSLLAVVVGILCVSTFSRLRALSARRKMLADTRDSLLKYRWEERQHREW